MGQTPDGGRRATKGKKRKRWERIERERGPKPDPNKSGILDGPKGSEKKKEKEK